MQDLVGGEMGSSFIYLFIFDTSSKALLLREINQAETAGENKVHNGTKNQLRYLRH
jgi:hypothetical protein